MTIVKQYGGMGFKELETFNISLLSKMAARVIREPDALWVRFLKGLYFANGEFLNAIKGARASWGWTSLLEGRYVIQDEGF